jgi:hypothetical protein
MIRIECAVNDADLAAWDKFVLATPGASFFVTSSWLRSYSNFGLSVEFILAKNSENEIVGGIPLVMARVPGVGVCLVPHGPIVTTEDSGIIDALIDIAEQEAKGSGAVFIQFHPFEPEPDFALVQKFAHKYSLGFREDVLTDCVKGAVACLVKRGFEPNSYSDFLPIPRQGQLVPLYDGDPLPNFRQGTRRDIRYAMQVPHLSTSEVTSSEELRTAFEVLEQSAQGKGYAIRPWSAFRSAVWGGIRARTTSVFLAHSAELPCAAVVVGFGGMRGAYVMGGTLRLRERKLFPAHLLQYRAMQEAAARGYSEYDLTAPGAVGSGVGDFKRGFRPTYYRLAGPYTKVLRPALLPVYEKIYPLFRKYRRGIALNISRIRMTFGRT